MRHFRSIINRYIIAVNVNETLSPAHMALQALDMVQLSANYSLSRPILSQVGAFDYSPTNDFEADIECSNNISARSYLVWPDCTTFTLHPCWASCMLHRLFNQHLKRHHWRQILWDILMCRGFIRYTSGNYCVVRKWHSYLMHAYTVLTCGSLGLAIIFQASTSAVLGWRYRSA